MVVVSSPSGYNLTGNLPKVVVAASPLEVVEITLKKAGDQVLQESYSPDANGLIEVDYGKIIEGLLSLSVPNFTNVPLLQSAAHSDFTVNITSNLGGAEVLSFHVIKGGVEGSGVNIGAFLLGNFLTWQVQTKEIKFYDPEFLTYFATSAANVTVIGYFKNDAPVTAVLASLDASTLTTINVSYGRIADALGKQPMYYDVFVKVGTDRVSFIQRYIYTAQEFDHESLFLFENSCGGFDTIRLTGELEEKDSPEFSSALFGDQLLDFDAKAGKSYTVNSGYFNSERHRAWSVEFINSLQKYFIKDGSVTRIISTKPEAKSVKGELATFEIDFILSKQSRYLNLNRSNAALPSLQIDTQNNEVFFLAPRLNELPWANSAEALIPVQYPYEDFFRKISLSAFQAENGSSTPFAVNAGIANHSLTAALATLATRAITADYAANVERWDGRRFTDFLDQPVRRNDAVQFLSVKADTISSQVYVSGYTGSGYKINPDGSAEFDRLTIRKDLTVNVLNIKEITGTGGSLAITNVAKILRVIDEEEHWKCEIDTDEGTIYVDLRPNDIIRCQVWNGKGLKYYTAIVTSIGSDYFYLSKASKIGGSIPEAGDAVFQFGNIDNASRQGLIYLTNSDEGAPYIDILDGINSENLAGKTKIRLGKLNGITDADFGALTGYGLYGQNVFVKGKIMVTGGNAQTISGAQAQANEAKLTAITTATNQAAADATVKASSAQVAAIIAAANDASAKVAAIKIGSKNLVRQSKATYTGANGLIKAYDLSEALIPGETYTATMHGICGVGAVFQIWVDGYNAAACRLLSTESVETVSATFVFQGLFGDPNHAWVYSEQSANPSTIQWIKIEKGNKATDWTPAPEDLSSDAQAKADAAQAAAQTYAAAQAAYEREVAKAYADGIVDTEESTRIAEVAAKLAEAKADATAKANAAQLAASIDAQTKASAAQTSAQNYATAQAAYEREVAKAYADGIVTAEESARITEVAAKLSEAKADATTKANAAQAAASTDAQNKATAAQSAAQTYAAAQSAYEREVAKAYADGIVDTEEAARIADAASKLAEAKADASTKANAAQAAAALDAQVKATVAQTAAQTYAATQAAYEREVAKAYADGIVTAEEVARIADVAAKLAEAKADATSKVNIAYAAANGYTDTKSSEALATAQSYADATATSKANAAQANAISSAATNAQAKADAAQAAAALLSQQLIDAVKLGGRNLALQSKQTLSGTGQIHVYPLSEPLIVGETYTVSMRGISGVGAKFQLWVDNNNDDVLRLTSEVAVETASASFIFMGQYGNPNIISVYSEQSADPSTVYWIKIEKGNKATDWTPATEDIQVAIDLAKSTADAANSSYAALTANLKSLAYLDVVEMAKLGTTIIENGKVKTTLLDADYIRTNVVNAGYINTLELDANIIKSGTIDSARINASQIISAGSGATTSFVTTAIGVATTAAEADATAKSSAAQVAAILAAANDAAAKISAIKLGSKNLVKGSKGTYTAASGLVKSYELSEPLIPGETYTATMRGISGVGAAFQMVVDGNNVAVCRIYSTAVIETVSATFVFGGLHGDATHTGVYSEQSVNPSTVYWIKIERGNKATDWTPAPEDLISDAQTKADVAQAAAQSYATAQAAYEREVAKAYADGKVTSEENARIADAAAKLAEAKADATTKAYAAQSAASSDAQTKATSAQIAAETYAAAQAAYEREVAKAYADGKVTTEEAARIAEAAAKLAEAKADATTKANAAQTAAATDAQTKATAAQNAAQTYAAAQASYEREVAKAYADGKVTTEENARIADAAAKLAEAKADATTKVNTAYFAANNYTDNKSANTLSLANNYTDAISQTKANAAQANAIAAASTDAQTKATAAQTAAAILSQELIDAVRIGGRNLVKASKYTATGTGLIRTYQLSEALIAGETYTATMRGISGIGANFQIWVDGANVPICRVTSTGSAQTVSATFVFNGLYGNSNSAWVFSETTSNPSTVYWIKIEKGNKGSDWSPATEDVQEAIDVAKTAADSANYAYAGLTANLKSLAFLDVVEMAKLGSTIIQNGMIKTTLLDANYIRSNVVNAGYISSLEVVSKKVATATIGRRIVIENNSLKYFNTNGGLAIELKETDGIVAFNVFDTSGNLIYQLGQAGNGTSPTPTEPTPFAYNGFGYSQAAAEGEVLGNANLNIGTLYYNPTINSYHTSYSGTYPFSYGSYAADGYYSTGSAGGIDSTILILGGILQ